LRSVLRDLELIREIIEGQGIRCLLSKIKGGIMPKGIAKSKFDFKNNNCEYLINGWCNMPRKKRCPHCLRIDDGTKACEVEI